MYTGLISVCIGAIPGQSFPHTDKERADSEKGEDNIMRIAADAFAAIARGLNR